MAEGVKGELAVVSSHTALSNSSEREGWIRDLQATRTEREREPSTVLRGISGEVSGEGLARPFGEIKEVGGGGELTCRTVSLMDIPPAETPFTNFSSSFLSLVKR